MQQNKSLKVTSVRILEGAWKVYVTIGIQQKKNDLIQ